MVTRGPARVVADGAVWLLENGADVARVQQAVEELGRATGMSESHAFALPTGVMLTVVDGAGFPTTLVRRVPRRQVRLDRLAHLEAVVAQAPSAGWPVGELWLRLREARDQPDLPTAVLALGSGLAAGGFCLFFGGSLQAGLVAAGLGALWELARRPLDRPGIPAAFVASAGAFVFTGAAQGAGIVLPAIDPAPLAIGLLMLLVPGLALVNALRDLMAGELVSSQARLAEVIWTAAAVAVGASAALAWGVHP